MSLGVGKSVYWVYKHGGKYHVHPDLLVINRISIDDHGWHYSLETESEEIIDWCRSSDLFESFKGAQDECDKRNYK